MVGYYKLDEEILKTIDFPIRNIEENIYDLCCPLLVMDYSSLPKELRYLYELLEIPILSYLEFQKEDMKKYQNNKKFLNQFSSYLKINIPIELNEEEQLGHLLRVGRYAYELAYHLGLEKEKIKKIYIAALFHDIGKSKIPAHILGKKGKLTDDEFMIMKHHSILSREVLGDFLKEEILEMIEAHHERMDGSGYSKGVVPSLGVQILGIADSYDAMISSRVYHDADTKEKALEELLLCTKLKEEGGKGILYNEDLVNLFIKIQSSEK